MKIYISGKITGDKFYKERFKEAEEKLKKIFDFDDSVDIYNPAEIDHGTYEMNLLIDIQKVFESDAVFMMKNWMDSPGALAENSVARAIRIPIIYEADRNYDEKLISLFKLLEER